MQSCCESAVIDDALMPSCCELSAVHSTSATSSSNPVVILGFGVAAVNALFALRDSGYTGRVVVVTNAGPMPYSPVLTSYYAAGRVARSDCFPWLPSELDALNVELITNAQVTRLDADAHCVHLADGESLTFSKCLIATGAHPVAPGFPHMPAFSPLFLRTMEDADRLKSALDDESCRDVLIAGTSMVALKTLEACLHRGKRVTLLGRSAQILRGSAHPLIAREFEKMLEQRGVILRLGDAVDTADDSCTSGIDITFAKDGVRQHFDQVVLAQGVKPSLEFVDARQIAMDKGVVVDAFMRSSNADVYAAGDVAQALELSSGESKVIALWANAVAQGTVAGRAIATARGEDDGCAMAAARGEDDGCATYSAHPALQMQPTCVVRPVRPYQGSIPCNTIHVADILFASAGMVAEGANVRIESERRDDVLVLRAFQKRVQEEQCVHGEQCEQLEQHDRAAQDEQLEQHDRAAQDEQCKCAAQNDRAVQNDRAALDAEALVGFNLLAVVEGATREDSLLNEIGCLKREILHRFL